MTFISVESLKAQYKTENVIVHAVDDVSFSLENGESIGIAGESACGKSTLGLSIMRILQGGKIVSGDITLEGKSILKMSESEFAKKVRWKDVSMVFQGAMNSLDPVFTVEEQFIEVLKQHHYDGDYKQRMSEIVNSIGLTHEVLKKYPHELSGGMKIGRAHV